ncbi:DNA translocase FtsK [Agrobacterium tumefaciens]|uniref:FtsK/SpoIIIE domain-containing protein n=1 Tax=Agrobacterium tumefaciens TaxID=358 RepID=UPI00157461A4|nr:DNA translocase FtsK [Agrobacterium tumefaciens]NSZ68173.1 DNA translocase FtsK [Agrobacterium tumefaciens]
MSNLSIIGKVAASRVAEEFTGEGGGPPSRVLFGIIDLDPAVTCAIAKEMAELTVPIGKVEVFVHPKIAGNGVHDIGKAQISEETATYHRGNTTADTALTVFSVPNDDTEAVRQSLAHVSVINSDWLTDDMGRWAQCGMPHANDALRGQLANVLSGIKMAGIVPEISMLADFVAEVEDWRTGPEGLPIADAVRRSLPALRLPKNSGDLRAAIDQSAEKAEAFFRKVHDDIRPALYLRGKDGESLNVIELRKRLEVLVAENEISPAAAVAIGSMLRNPNVGSGDWLPEQDAVARLSWDQTELLFSDTKKKAPATFGQETLDFFQKRHPGVLTKTQEDVLQNLRRDSAGTSEVHSQFFTENATRLADEPKLFRRWEKLIYKKPVEAIDLHEGLLRLMQQTMQNVGDEHIEDPAVVIRLRRSSDLNFWTLDKNTRLCRYIRDRFRGIDMLLSPDVFIDFGWCWKNWDKPGGVDNTSDSKTATSFEFEAYYVEAKSLADGRRDDAKKWESYLKSCPKAQMAWSPKPNAMGLSFSDDIQVLSETGEAVTSTGSVPLLRSSVSANRYDKHGSIQTINLDNQSSINDARFDNNGHLANDKVEDNVIDTKWLASLARITEQGIITEKARQAALFAFEAFRLSYGKAIRAMRSGAGLADPNVMLQAELYGLLIATLKTDIFAPLAIRELWLPLLQIGLAHVNTDRPTVLVAGWSPLRLAEGAVKASQLVSAMRDVLHKSSKYAGEMEPYLKDTIRNLSATYYQDVALSFGHKPEILVETVRSLDVSLMESPRPGESVIADEPADDIADNFDMVARDYLKLRPHEKANFSTMLLNSESEGLPVQLADHMAALMEKESSLRCDLVLTHEDAGQLRRIYEQQNRRIGYEVDSALTSEAARTFLSRLRVGIISPDVLDAAYGKGHDIVILHGVVSRKADIRWARVPAADSEAKFLTHVPASHSKKKPFHKGDTASGTFLTSPSQIVATQAYLDAMHACIHQTTSPEDHWLPMQEVEFQSGAVKDLMTKAHSLAEWVMTYDRIADRRLLSSDERRILRYYSSPRSDHNVIISTEINAKKLGERLMKDLRIAIPSASTDELDEIVRAVHRQSASLSGAVVMRGAERVNHAHELLGLVLARREMEALLQINAAPDMQRTAWFFIDDYLQWLEIGQPRADILAVNFAKVDGKPMVRLTVGEAKFVTLSGVNEHKRHSLEQLASTVAVLTKRLVSPDGTINPLGWRSRIADLVLEHIDPFDHIDGMTFEDWLHELRDGTLPITVSGHSLVYVHDMEEDPKREALVPDQEMYPKENRRLLAQWTFGRPSIAGGFRDLVKETSPSRLSVPVEWPTNPYAVPSDIVPPTNSELPNVIEHIKDFAIENDPLGTDHSAEAVVTEVSSAVTPIPSLEQVIENIMGSDADMPDEAITAPPGEAPAGWLPSVWKTLMAMNSNAAAGAGEAWLDEQAAALRNALQTEGQQATILERRLTPNSAILTLDGTKGVGVTWLEKNATNLRTRYGLDISRITPLTMRIAVTINRPKRAVLHLSDAWSKRALESTSPMSNGALVVGDKEMDGELLYLPLFDKFGDIPRAAPHTLVSGTTGSGKGILATNLMLDLCAFNSPENLRLYLIDPKKGVDYGWIEKMPHLEGSIIGEQDEATSVFRGLVTEMESRYETLRDSGVANVNLYQKLEYKPKPMPRIVLVFDEVANWMQDEAFKDEVTSLINQLATKSRAAGIHIVMIYQRADVQVMSMQLRANLGNKLILRLGDEGSSKIALGERGAEKLLGGGHLIAKIDSDEKFYAQVPFLDPEEETAKLGEAIILGWKAAFAGSNTAD